MVIDGLEIGTPPPPPPPLYDHVTKESASDLGRPFWLIYVSPFCVSPAIYPWHENTIKTPPGPANRAVLLSRWLQPRRLPHRRRVGCPACRGAVSVQ